MNVTIELKSLTPLEKIIEEAEKIIKSHPDVIVQVNVKVER